MKPSTFQTRGLVIQALRDFDGLYFIAWKPHTSCGFRVRQDLIKWCGYPVKTPTRDALVAWLDGLDQGKPAKAEQDKALLKATGFGPEQHEDDPTANTRMIT